MRRTDRATYRLNTAQVLQITLHEKGESDQAAMDYSERKYVDEMKLNSPVLNAKGTVVLFSVIGLVGVSCLLANKTGKKKKNS